MTVCERIDRELKKRNLSRRQLALKAGIPPSSFQSAMQRNGDLSFDMLFKVFAVLHLTLDDFFGHPTTDEDQAEFEDYISSKAEEAVCISREKERKKLLSTTHKRLDALDYKGVELAAEIIGLIYENPRYRLPENTANSQEQVQENEKK